MTYKIINVSHVEDTVITTVELQLISSSMTIDIPHFRPESNEEIDQNIKNRAISEQSKIEAMSALIEFVPTIITGEIVTF